MHEIDLNRNTRQAINFMLAALLVVLVLVGCSKNEKPKEVSLAMLSENATRFDNSHVITRGIVRHFDVPFHYWIEDEDLNRLEIFPHESVAQYLGETVVVEGHFRYSRTEGRRLTLTKITRAR